MFTTQYPPLTEDEQARRGSPDATEAERVRLYARDLLATASAYGVAADAKGLAPSAARYLAAEAVRLHKEGQAWLERADELDAA